MSQADDASGASDAAFLKAGDNLETMMMLRNGLASAPPWSPIRPPICERLLVWTHSSSH